MTHSPFLEAILLAIGSTDRNIHLWTSSEDNFVQAAVLSGHEDWVKSLAFRTPQSAGDALILASGSQDANIRLWNIEPFTKTTLTSSGASTSEVTDELLDAFEASLVNLEDTEDGGRQISLKRHILTVKSIQQSQQLFTVTFDALLIGHEAGVTALSWRPQNSPDDTPTLLSTSTDSSLILWSPSTVLTSASDGTTLWINRQRFGDVGGQRLGGFVGGPDGSTVPVWHEIARPQVHGYDLIGAAFLDPLCFVSIADEKVVRVFEAPSEFVEVVNNLGIARLESAEVRTVSPVLTASNLAYTASAVAELNGAADDARTRRRPFEGELAAVTLWPEIEKVFGHGYESIALAVSNDKQCIATACKATSQEHAVVRVYETQTWQLVGQPLPGHNLTVTQIAFSPDDSLILSVSRDRSWRLFEKSAEGYVPVAADKSHGRIIWDCAWAPEGDIFATASRDKTIKVWRRAADANSKWTAVATIAAKAAATAVSFAARPPESKSRTLAVGLETGEIMLFASPRQDPSQWKATLTIDSRYVHAIWTNHEPNS
ncbi:hypothetical protein BN946_scf185043.g61 [Trametes cinnabarina]|uniref:Elongator complex protein 2 n=1 Tax=Pycnoporus cinnabarinus TaxID=5643 RepID=A0A060SHM4_PYCCI|nr:hypothetical protein BN946_scf185043.g61 [Trametes cinnabarina]